MDIEQYLRREGVKLFQDPRSYQNWVNRTLGSKMAKQYFDAQEERSTGEVSQAKEFYDRIANPEIIPVAASFEYGLLVQIARWVENRLPRRGTIVELGCHSGLLTRYYALARPDASFIGIDRSEPAILIAQKKAQEQKITNLRFVRLDVQDDAFLPDIHVDVIITGRVIGEWMDMLLRRRISWKDYQFPPMDTGLDEKAKKIIQNCVKMLSPSGKFLVTERISSFDRFNRLWQLFQSDGCFPDPHSVTQVNWADVSGSHASWFFQCDWGRNRAGKVGLEIDKLPWVSKEVDATQRPTRLMLDGILAWQTWRSLMDAKVVSERTYQWDSGEEIHYEIGETGPGLGYAYVASNTDLHLLTLFLPQEAETVNRDLEEYGQRLKSSGAKILDRG